MSLLVTEITVRLVAIKIALKRHAEPSEVDALELDLLRTVAKCIATGDPHAIGHARVVFAVERMRLAQIDADIKKADEDAAWEIAVASVEALNRKRKK